jgi:cytochrome c oxidase subunit II
MKSPSPFIASLAGVSCIFVGVLCFVLIHDRMARASALNVKVIAHEWWWEFDYPSLGVRTSDVLYLPSRTHLRLELVSGDVIHTFWIAGMKDSVVINPGKVSRLDLVIASPGELHGNCDSGCGCRSVCMRFDVLASAPLEFERWAAAARLHYTQFKAPRKTDAPACFFNSGRTAHSADKVATNPVQQLLDGNATARQQQH